MRDKVLKINVLLKDAKKITWQAVQENRVKATREICDAAVEKKFGKRISEEQLTSMQAQFYWADAYHKVFTMLDQHWGKWKSDEKTHQLNTADKDLRVRLEKEMQAIDELEQYLNKDSQL